MSANADDDAMLLVDEVASKLRVRRETVRDWIARGRLRAVRVVRGLRVRRADLNAFLEGAAANPP